MRWLMMTRWSHDHNVYSSLPLSLTVLNFSLPPLLCQLGGLLLKTQCSRRHHRNVGEMSRNPTHFISYIQQHSNVGACPVSHFSLSSHHPHHKFRSPFFLRLKSNISYQHRPGPGFRISRRAGLPVSMTLGCLRWCNDAFLDKTVIVSDSNPLCRILQIRHCKCQRH